MLKTGYSDVENATGYSDVENRGLGTRTEAFSHCVGQPGTPKKEAGREIAIEG
jgi:hypothetical protein